MPRRYSSDSSDGLPELDDFISRHVKGADGLQAPKLIPTIRPWTTLTSSERTTTQKSPRKPMPLRELKSLGSVSKGRGTSTRSTGEKRTAKVATRQPTQSNASDLDDKSIHFSNATKLRATPHRAAKKAAPVIKIKADSDEDSDSEYMTAAENSEQSEVEESIWCDSDADSPRPVPRKSLVQKSLVSDKTQEDVLARLKTLQIRKLTPDTELSESEDDLDSTIFRSRSPKKPLKTYKSPAKPRLDFPSLAADSSDKENDSIAGLRLPPPPTLVKPASRPAAARPLTPPPAPASPSKSKLVSPSKKKIRIPTPPHRPSIDAFWNPHAVNDWNDQYSPQKPLLSPKKNRLLPRDDSASDSPLSSPGKSQSPTKRTRAEIQAKKDFESRKHRVCEDFFAELDEKVTEGKIKELAESTGGVKFIWSKTLNSTAGRANWRKETKKTSGRDGMPVVVYKHHASIELAEKVIDDEERLLNVVAHEFCHLANFMVSGIKDQPHGRQFKAWGAKCTKAFGDRGVEVTTKHSYQIDYKYIWSCTNELCGQEFKRHSKSIDPSRHTCGVCRAKLEQIKPVPRRQNNAGGGKAAVGGYAGFVKQNFAAIKEKMAGASHKEVMTAIGQRYREQKAALAAKTMAETATEGVDDMVKALEVVTLD